MRYACLDVGDERIGVAISDASGWLASPLETIQRVSGAGSYLRLKALFDERGIEAIVVGLPLLPEGAEGKQVASTRAYVKGMAEHIALPVIYWDERQSSAEADAIMAANARSKRRRKREIDAVAAAVILQGYLDHSFEGGHAAETDQTSEEEHAHG